MNDDLVGREGSLRELTDWLAGALAGLSSVLFVAGEAGVGKTSLVRSVLAAADADVVEGVGIEDGDAPYGPVVSALRQLRRDRECHSHLQHAWYLLANADVDR